MKILFISKSGDGLGMAHHLYREGHEVLFHTKESGFQYAGLGVIDVVRSWRPHLDSVDLVLSDMVGFGHIEKTLKKLDKKYLGFNELIDMFELDRDKQMQVFNRAGIRIPDTVSYSSPIEAEDHAIPSEGVVIKPSGNLETGKTMLVKDKRTFQYALEQFATDQKLIVQRVIQGVEVSTEGWFDGRRWAGFNHTFEEKRFMDGSKGPHTGCMGNVVVPAPVRNQLVDNLKRLEGFLLATGYRGPVDLNTIVNQSGIFALEATPRFGYDAIEALTELTEMNLSEILFRTSTGTLDQIPFRNGFAAAVRLSIPPFPNGEASVRDRGLPVLGTNPMTAHHHWTDLYWDKRDKVAKWAGSDGVLMKVTSYGRTLKKAMSLAYERVDKVHAMDLQYRSDIGVRVVDEWNLLKKWRVVG